MRTDKKKKKNASESKNRIRVGVCEGRNGFKSKRVLCEAGVEKFCGFDLRRQIGGSNNKN